MSVGRLALVIVLQILLHTCKAGAGEILTGPSNQTVPLNTIANFFCRAWGHNARWYINSTIVDSHSQPAYEDQGFTFTEITTNAQDQNHIYNFNVTVQATAAVNTTNFTCVAYLDRPDVSAPAHLIVMGAPEAPNVSLHLVDDSTLQLSWEPPFTWPQYEILHYTVDMENRSSGYVLPPVTLSPSETAHTLRASAPLQSCAELRFSVTAHTAIGAGTPAVVTGGFPIAAVLNDTTMTTTVTFRSDGTPIVGFKFQVCPYQELSYTITFRRVDAPSLPPIVSGPRIVEPYSDQRSAPVVLYISRGLVNNARYSATVNVGTSAGMTTSSSEEHSFVTRINIASTTEAPTGPQGGGDQGSGDQTGTQEGRDLAEFLLKVIVPAAVGILILIAAVLVALIVVIHLRQRHIFMFRSRRASKDMSHPRPMVPNPIYEGPVYETIDPHFHALPQYRGPPQYPLIESNLDNKFAVLNTNAAVPINGTVTAAVPTDTFPSSVRSEDNYTVMCSARATTVPTQPANNDNSTIRYVQDPSGR